LAVSILKISVKKAYESIEILTIKACY